MTVADEEESESESNRQTKTVGWLPPRDVTSVVPVPNISTTAQAVTLHHSFDVRP
jgi:hypothetical protein